MTREESQMRRDREEVIKIGESELCDPGNLLLLGYITVMVCILILGVLWDVAGAETEERWSEAPDRKVQSGQLLMAMEDGSLQPSALLSQQVEIKVSGIIARVRLEQHFVNPLESWIEAVYVFPLPDESSVDHLRLRVGDRVLEGLIMEKQEAERSHERARRQGKKSSLLVQNRPNIFTTRVANIGPGEEVSVEIEYQQQVRFADQLFSLRFPMVVGPRYIPGLPLKRTKETARAEGSEVGEDPVLRVNTTGWAVDTDQVPDGSQITPPVDLGARAPIPVKIQVDLAAGFPLSRLESLYHLVRRKQLAEGHYEISLTGEVKADRDFVLEWQAEDVRRTQVALFAENKGSSQYMLLMLMPPQIPEKEPVPREVIFILDVSGSMAGPSIVQAKSAVALALLNLKPSDRFNIITFSNSVDSLFLEPVSADHQNLNRARTYLDRLKADGGTEMKPALLLALDGSEQHPRLRQVVFLTDGAVGNEEQLLELIRRRLGDSRFFTVGIGSAPNSYFMSRAASMGRGTFCYIGKEDEVQEKMTNLFNKLEHPVLSHLQLDLGESGVDFESFPSPLPDLYQGEPLVLAVRTDWENSSLHLKGSRLGHPWETTVDSGTYGPREGIAGLWARKKIRSEMESLALGGDRGRVKETVLKTALEHHLVSRYTSLVAIDSEQSRPGGAKEQLVPVKTHMPSGWQPAAVFGGGARTATPATLRLLAGLALLTAAALIMMMKRQRWQGSGN